MKTLILFLVAAISGCAIQPKWNNDTYGRLVNKKEFEDEVRTTLKDPYSAVVHCNKPRQAYAGGYYGYASVCLVNAKNSFGAYVGEQYIRYIRNYEGIHKLDRYQDIIFKYAEGIE